MFTPRRAYGSLLIETIYCKIFRSNYLRKKKKFPKFFLDFQNLDSIFNIFNQKMTLIADVFFNWRTPKNMLR